MDEKANRILIANISITAANKEAPWAIPRGCIWFTMQCRTAVDVRIAVEAGKVASSEPPYLTMKSGTSWDEHDLGIDIQTGHPIFFAAASAVVVEIVIGIHREEV